MTLKKTEPGKFSYLYPKTKQGIDRAVATLINKKSIGIIKLVCSHKNKAKRIISNPLKRMCKMELILGRTISQESPF